MYHPYFYEKLAEAKQAEQRRSLHARSHTQGDVVRATTRRRRLLITALRRALGRGQGNGSAGQHSVAPTSL